MFRALLICSDEECTELFEAYGALAELEALACDCGCALHVVALHEVEGQREQRGFELSAAL